MKQEEQHQNIVNTIFEDFMADEDRIKELADLNGYRDIKEYIENDYETMSLNYLQQYELIQKIFNEV